MAGDRPGRLILLLHVDERRSTRVPVVTLSLVGLCLATFGVVAGVTLARGPELPVRWFAELGLVPGALRWHTLLTYWLLHEHLWHLSVNMLLLLLFGTALEEGIGSVRMAALFLSAAVVTGLTESAATVYGPFRDDSAMVIGASGAVAAVLGMFASRYHSSLVSLGGTRLRFRVLPLILVMALAEIVAVGYRASGLREMLQPPPANWAHMAGFLYGILIDQSARLCRRLMEHSRARQEQSGERDREYYEDVLADNPHDAEALIRLPLLLLAEGARDDAMQWARTAVKEALERSEPGEAADRYAALRVLTPHLGLADEQAMALAAALASRCQYEDAVAIYRHVAATTNAGEVRGRAVLRAATHLIRHLHRADEAVELLQQALAEAGDAEWAAYGHVLLNAAARREVTG